jgi:hypothetical protein
MTSLRELRDKYEVPGSLISECLERIEIRKCIAKTQSFEELKEVLLNEVWPRPYSGTLYEGLVDELERLDE